MRLRGYVFSECRESAPAELLSGKVRLPTGTPEDLAVMSSLSRLVPCFGFEMSAKLGYLQSRERVRVALQGPPLVPTKLSEHGSRE